MGFILAVWMLQLITHIRPGDLPNTDDGTVDVNWAHVWADQGFRLNGHWSFTLTGFHPGPWYMATLTVGGKLASTLLGASSFASGSAIAIAFGYAVMLIAAALILGASFASVRLAWIGLALFVLSSLRLDGTNTWHHATFAIPTWPGSWFAASMLLNFTAAVALARKRSFAGVVAVTVSGLSAQLYLTFWPVAFAVGGWAVASLFSRPRTSSRAFGMFLVGSIMGWGPLIARAVLHGPAVFLPPLARVDHEGYGLRLAEGIRTVAFHAPFGSTVVAVLLWAGIIAVATLAARRRTVRLTAAVVLAFAALALFQQLILFPGPVTMYQTNWVELFLAGCMALGLHVFLSSVSSQAIRGVVTGVLALATVAGVYHGVSVGSIPRSPSIMLGESKYFIGPFTDWIKQHDPLPEHTVEITYDGKNIPLFMSMPQVLQGLNVAGIDACMREYPARYRWQCRGTGLPLYEMIVDDNNGVTSLFLAGGKGISFRPITEEQRPWQGGVVGVDAEDSSIGRVR